MVGSKYKKEFEGHKGHEGWYMPEAILAAANGIDDDDKRRDTIIEGIFFVGSPRTTLHGKANPFFEILAELRSFFQLVEGDDFRVPVCFVCKDFSDNEVIGEGGRETSDSRHWIFIFFIDKSNALIINPFGANVDDERYKRIIDAFNNINNNGKAPSKKTFWISNTKIQTDGKSCGPISAELARFFREEYTSKPKELLKKLNKQKKDCGTIHSVDVKEIISEKVFQRLKNPEELRKVQGARLELEDENTSTTRTPDQRYYDQLVRDNDDQFCDPVKRRKTLLAEVCDTFLNRNIPDYIYIHRFDEKILLVNLSGKSISDADMKGINETIGKFNEEAQSKKWFYITTIPNIAEPNNRLPWNYIINRITRRFQLKKILDKYKDEKNLPQVEDSKKITEIEVKKLLNKRDISNIQENCSELGKIDRVQIGEPSKDSIHMLPKEDRDFENIKGSRLRIDERSSEVFNSDNIEGYKKFKIEVERRKEKTKSFNRYERNLQSFNLICEQDFSLREAKEQVKERVGITTTTQQLDGKMEHTITEKRNSSPHQMAKGVKISFVLSAIFGLISVASGSAIYFGEKMQLSNNAKVANTFGFLVVSAVFFISLGCLVAYFLLEKYDESKANTKINQPELEEQMGSKAKIE